MDAPLTIACVHGSTRGIGLAMVEALLTSRPDLHVVATGRSALGCEALDKLKQSAGERLEIRNADITDEPSLAAVMAALGDRGSLRLSINCVGLLHNETMQPEKRLADLDVETLLQSYRVNALGHALVYKHTAPILPRRGRVVIASLSARVGSIEDNRLGGWYGYRSSKAAQNMLTRTAAIELKRRNPETICVALHPGTTETELSRPFRAGVPAQKLFSPERAARALLEVLAGLSAEDSGTFFAWDGSKIPW